MERSLGELEQLVLLALLRLGEEGYGVAVQRLIEERTGRSPVFATIYTTLNRLEAKGYVTATVGEPSPERGGRAKKFYAVSGAGRTALRRSMSELRAMTQGLGGSWSAP
jgi:DNA-binding PadR family transcriptional regulator